jgi:hypothetical protein
MQLNDKLDSFRDSFRGIKLGTHSVRHRRNVALINTNDYVESHDLHQKGNEYQLMWVLIDNNDMNLYHTITQEQYDQFLYYYPWDAIKGLRYGQSFCERFGISNASPLYHFKEQCTADRWIRDNYLVNDER